MLQKYFPFFTAVAIFLLLHALITNPQYIAGLIVSALGVACLSIVFILRGSNLTTLDQFRFVMSTLFFSSIGCMFFVFLEQNIFQYATAVLISVIIFLYLENVFRFAHNTASYQVSSLRNVAAYMHLLSLFFLSVVLFNLRFFFTTPLPLTSMYAFVGGTVLILLWVWTERVFRSLSWWMWVSIGLLYAQFVVAITFWPHIPLVKGMVTTALVYGMMHILLLALKDTLTKKRMWRTISVVGGVLIVTLLTSQWI